MTDEELIEQVARVIIGPHEPVPEGSQYSIETLRVIRWDHAENSLRNDALWAARAIFPIIKAEVDKWRNAVIDELTSLHIYNVEHDADPRKAVRDIVKWNQHLALDPAVSAEARALRVRGGEMVKEAAIKHLEDCYENARANGYDDHAQGVCDAADELHNIDVPAIVEAGDGKK